MRDGSAWILRLTQRYGEAVSPSLGHHGVFLLEIFCLPIERITASRLQKCGSSPKVSTIETGLSAARALISTTTMPTLKHRALQLVAWRVHYRKFIAARRSQLNGYTVHKVEHEKGPLETASYNTRHSARKVCISSHRRTDSNLQYPGKRRQIKWLSKGMRSCLVKESCPIRKLE